MLDELRQLLARRGKLNSSLIDVAPETRNSSIYIRRFGSLAAAYQRIGYAMNATQRAASARFHRGRKA